LGAPAFVCLDGAHALIALKGARALMEKTSWSSWTELQAAPSRSPRYKEIVYISGDRDPHRLLDHSLSPTAHGIDHMCCATVPHCHNYV